MLFTVDANRVYTNPAEKCQESQLHADVVFSVVWENMQIVEAKKIMANININWVRKVELNLLIVYALLYEK